MRPSLAADPLRSSPSGPGQTPRRSAFCLSALCLLFLAPCAIADDLGFFASRRILSDAGDALASGKLDTAVDLYTQVIEGTDEGKGRHAQALLGAAVAELGRPNADVAAARKHLDAYVASYEAEQKGVARALLQLLEPERTNEGRASRPEAPALAGGEPSGDGDGGDSAPAEAAERIAALERQLAAARRTIAEKEQLIEELRKIVVEGDG